MQITLLAVVTLEPAELPNAMFPLPEALFASALVPMAVLAAPVVLLESAEPPIAVLKLAVVLLKSALSPIAVFKEPVLLLNSVNAPWAVLPFPPLRRDGACSKSAPAPTAVFSFAVAFNKSVACADGRVEVAVRCSWRVKENQLRYCNCRSRD